MLVINNFGRDKIEERQAVKHKLATFVLSSSGKDRTLYKVEKGNEPDDNGLFEHFICCGYDSGVSGSVLEVVVLVGTEWREIEHGGRKGGGLVL
jgi:hypothetical protein